MPDISTFRSGKTDYYQVGWLVAWVLDMFSADYHRRTWDTQEEAIKNPFISELICNGRYNRELLPASWLHDGKALQKIDTPELPPTTTNDFLLFLQPVIS